MAYIMLTSGKKVLVDEELLDALNTYTWYEHNEGYAHRADFTSGKKKMILLHRQITKAKPGQIVDHINNIRSDCRRSNLRLCNIAENNRHRSANKSSKSGLRGVGWRKDKGRWECRIKFNNQSVFLGFYDDALDAAHVYDQCALQLHGAYAWTNFCYTQGGQKDKVCDLERQEQQL